MKKNELSELTNIQSFLIATSYKCKEKDILNWWNEFLLYNKAITECFSASYKGNFDIPKWMKKNLQLIDKNLMWEFRPGVQKRHALVITSEERRDLRLLAQKIVNNAPKLDDWEFFAYRLPENMDEIPIMISDRTGWNSIRNIGFKIFRNRINRIDIIYHLPFIDDEKTSLNNLFLLTIFILGEEVTEKWIGDIKVCFSGDTEGFDHDVGKLYDLKAKISEKIESIKESLPRVPYFLMSDDAIRWNILKFSPEKQRDYFDKDDVLLYTTVSIELFESMRDKYFFDSIRFSKCNELFVYLKISVKGKEHNESTISTVERELNKYLKNEDLGCVIGRGIGLKYLYLDLAIINIYKAIEKIIQVLRICGVGEKSWVLFYDAELAYQWLGISDKSPPPLLR